MKRCITCKKVKKISEFGKRTDSKDGYRGQCKECRKYARISRIYDLDQEDYLDMLTKQKNKCYICREKVDQLCVDHNHKNGKVRGLLCHNCNKALGLLNDKPMNLIRSLIYLFNRN